MNLDILGTSYELIYSDEEKYPLLKDKWGYTDTSSKEIVVCNIEHLDCEISNPQEFINKVTRHEVIHAYMYESGLDSNSHDTVAWANDEEIIDWFAIQFYKIHETFTQIFKEERCTKND